MQRRIYGIETEYGITCVLKGQRRLTPDEVARYLFRTVVAWGRSSNVFLTNAGRLYLDVGSHPEFATPECDSVLDAVMYDKAGELILNDLVENAEKRLKDEGIRGSIFLFKNNTDSAGNSYGCHENFLIRRALEPNSYEESFIPFLVTRQIIAGAGKIVNTVKGPVYSISQRAEHIWEGISSATTRSRPIINTRDEPHADAEEFKRLHVIVGDSNMSEYTSFLKVGSAACVLRMLESGLVHMRDLTLENPIRAIREISSDVTCRRPVRLASGKEMSALDIQSYILEHALSCESKGIYTDEETRALRMWEDVMSDLSDDPMKLDRKIDWVIKKRLIDNYCERHGYSLESPEVQMLDLRYHDIHNTRGVYNTMRRRGAVDTLLTDDQIDVAKTMPPQTTRASLRGRFIQAAMNKGRDYTVDWVHLKVNDQSQRTVVCKDPFRAEDERVDRLIESL
jgi:proteasome accessory factor A